MISIDRMHEILDEVVNGFPEAFFQDLNGGISLLPDIKYSPHAKADDLYVLGEYRHDAMGRYIYLYYGSFIRVHGRLDESAMAEQLFKVVAHEFTHHLESLAGERGLEIKDEQQMAEYNQRQDL